LQENLLSNRIIYSRPSALVSPQVEKSQTVDRRIVVNSLLPIRQ
jgi:hypothetical protein